MDQRLEGDLLEIVVAPGAGVSPGRRDCETLMLEHQFVAQRLVAGRGKADETVVKRRVAHADLSNSTVVAPASWSIANPSTTAERIVRRKSSAASGTGPVSLQSRTLSRSFEHQNVASIRPVGPASSRIDAASSTPMRVLDRFHIEEFAGHHRSGEPQHTKVGGVGRHRDDDRFVGNGWGGAATSRTSKGHRPQRTCRDGADSQLVVSSTSRTATLFTSWLPPRSVDSSVAPRSVVASTRGTGVADARPDSGRPPSVDVDLVVTELVANAIDHTDAPAIDLTVVAEDRHELRSPTTAVPRSPCSPARGPSRVLETRPADRGSAQRRAASADRDGRSVVVAELVGERQPAGEA